MKPYQRLLCSLLLLTSLAPAAFAQDDEGITVLDGFGRVRNEAERVADTENVALVLVTSGDEVSADGDAESLVYFFVTEGGEIITVNRSGDNVAGAQPELLGAVSAGVFTFSAAGLADLDPIEDPEGEFGGTEDRIVDSGEAVRAADDAGGREFRQETAGEAELSFILVRLPLGFFVASSAEEADDPRTFYIVKYEVPFGVRANEEEQVALFIVDAETGEVVNQFRQRTFEEGRGDVADNAAQFAADAQLVSIRSVLGDVTVGGRSLVQLYTYYSPRLGEFRSFLVAGDDVIFEFDPAEGLDFAGFNINPEQMQCRQAIPTTGIITTARAIEVALFFLDEDVEDIFGDERGNLVDVHLSCNFEGFDEEDLLYKLTFTTLSNGEIRTVYVNARTGRFVTVAIEDGELSNLRGGIALGRSYPNPVRSSALIQYVVGNTGNVTLAVYDALGRKVRDLVNGTQAAGQYGVTWDGLDSKGAPVASGVYIYRLSNGNASQSKTLTVVR